MSMAEYMCKLFYGRRGIQLNDEQFALLFPSRSSNYLALSLPPSKPPPSSGEEQCKSSREAWSFSEHLNHSPSPYRLSHTTSLPTVYSPFPLPSFNFSTPSSTNTDFHSPYLTYLQTTAYPTYDENYTRLRYTDVEASLLDHTPSEHDSDSSKASDKIDAGSKAVEAFTALQQPTQCMQTECTLRSGSGASKSPEDERQPSFLDRWSNYNQDSFFFAPMQQDHNKEWSNCAFQKGSPQLMDFEKTSDFSSVKKESCVYLSSDFSFADAASGDGSALCRPFEAANVDVTTLNINCSACRHPELNLLYKPTLMDPLPTDYPPVFDTSHYQQYPPRHKDFSSRSQCFMNARLEMELPGKMKSLQHMCAVCGDHAACQHYGVRTCEGCKGFFKRTVQKGAVYVCLSGKNCPIDKRRRNRCQFCRFEKCLSVGMVKEVVRTDLLKGRRGRLPSKPKLLLPARDSSLSPPTSFITSLVRAYVDTAPDLQTLNFTHFNGPLSTAIPGITTKAPASDQAYHDLLCSLLEACIRVSVEWSTCLPGFDSLCQHDQQLLFHASLLELIVMRIAFKFDTNDSSLTFCDGTILDYNHYIKHPTFSWLDSVVDFSTSFKSLQDCQLDLSTFSCLLALSMSSHRAGVQEAASVDKLQSTIVEALRKHLHDQTLCPSLLPAALAKLTELRNSTSAVLATFADLSKSYKNSTESRSILQKLVYFANLSN